MSNLDILDLREESTYTPASKLSRFGNFLIDRIGFILLIVLNAFFLDDFLGVIPEDGSVLLVLYFFVLYIGYFTVSEHYWGKSPAKFITRTHVVTHSGERPTFSNILSRNLCRLIPFDSLSFLFSDNGFHDDFSKTSVADDK